MKKALVVTELLREVTNYRQWGVTLDWRVPFRPIEMTDHFPTPLSWRSFKIGSEDYDGPANEAYCPCGAVVHLDEDGLDTVLGDFVDAAEAHIEAGHPGVRRA